MSVNKYLKELSKPFAPDCVKWRLQSTNADKTGGYAVAYLDSRAIAKRLDDVVGQMRWKDEYKPWISSKEGASQICIISIYDDDLKEWISKSDGAGMSAVEPIKGGISDAFKRAAVKWGIGRYLYSMEAVWVKAKPKGKSVSIEDAELPKLQQKYMAFLKNLKEEDDIHKQPAAKLSEKTKASSQSTSEPNSARTQQNTPIYEILGIKAKGENSLLQIKHKDKIVTAYYNGSDNNLKAGTKLGRVSFTSKDTAYGKVHILQDYDLAA